MFYKDTQHFYRVKPWDEFEWLEHGFGTRQAATPAGVATLHQIHSKLCIVAEGRGGLIGEGDALLENTPGRMVAIKTADCIPLLLADPVHRAVAAVHAGWRGTVARIGPAAVEAMARRFGSRPEDLHAAIGPGIGRCCYEVGPEVAAEFGYPANGRIRLDLTAVNRDQLLAAGLPQGQIHAANLCTMCNPDDFYSFRRDREQAGRMYAVIGVRGA